MGEERKQARDIFKLAHGTQFSSSLPWYSKMARNHRRLLLIQIVLQLLLSTLGAADDGTCDGFLYGKPQVADCTTLFDNVTKNQILTSRLFVEEQFRADENNSWPGIDNPFASPIVQLPKYYSKSQFSRKTPISRRAPKAS